MGKKYNYEDAWEELEDFYGDAVLDTSDAEYDKYALTYGEDDHPEYVDNIVLDIIDGDGITLKYELVGRLDIREKSYLILHRMNDANSSVVNIVRAWDNEDGELCVAEITDEEEAKEVYERAQMLLNDEGENWHDIPGGGFQLDD